MTEFAPGVKATRRRAAGWALIRTTERMTEAVGVLGIAIDRDKDFLTLKELERVEKLVKVMEQCGATATKLAEHLGAGKT